MNSLKTPLFLALFNSLTPCIILKTDAPNFTIIACNDAFKAVSYTSEMDIAGFSLWEAFHLDKTSAENGKVIMDALFRAIKTNQTVPLSSFNNTSQTAIKLWQLEIIPIAENDDKPKYLVITIYDNNDKIKFPNKLKNALLRKISLPKKGTLTYDFGLVKNEELANINKKLIALNEELILVQNELLDANLKLEERVLNRTKELAYSEALMHSAIESAQMGTWYIHTETREFKSSARTREIFGFDHDKKMTYHGVLARIHTDQRQMVLNAIENSIQQYAPFNVEYQIDKLNDNEIVWVRCIGNIHYDDNGKPDFITGVIQDITEQKQDEQRKNDFIGMVSHELKTPLTSLSAYIQILQKGFKGTDQTLISLLDKAYGQIKRMNRMINGFLTISHLESGKIHLNKQHFRLDKLLAATIEEISMMGPDHQFKLLPGDEIVVFADQEKIINVISNILINAVKYSPGKTLIEVRCYKENDHAIVSVKDYGIGIKLTDMEKLFERYYRVEGNNSISGFGIGLYLSAEIIHRHNGNIWVESEVGKGSTFYFSLPIDADEQLLYANSVS
jgi:two-component system sensor histidine kinase VicK